jgi:hypothetical protein
MLMDPAQMKATIRAAGGPTTATELGLPASSGAMP